MKTIRTFVFSILLGLAAIAAMPTHARADVSIGFFYDSLSPYGEWVSTDDYGYCWRPSHVSDSWRPYSDGYWAYTDDGWTWVSYEDYGSIVYHYGRWVDLDNEGWCWVPGYEWAPAWVSWRSGGDYVGWAPLPPAARFSVGVSFGGGVDAEFDIGPGYYNFCPVAHFGDPDLAHVIVNHEENTTIINNTTNITNINVNKVNKTVYNGGPNINAINRRVNKPIQRLNLVRENNVQGGIRGHRKGNDLVMPAPVVNHGGGNKVAPPKVARHLGKAKANHGWNGVKDAQRQQIENKFKADAQRPKGEAAQAAEPGGNANQGKGAGKGEGKHHKGEANLQPFLGGGAAAQPQNEGGKKGKGENRKNREEAAAAAAAQQNAAEQQQREMKRKEKQHNNNAQQEQLKRQRQAEAAQAEQQQAEKAARRQNQAEQAAKAERQQQRAEEAAKAQRQQMHAEEAAKAQRQQMRQQEMQRQQAPQQQDGGKGEGKHKGKKKDQQDNQN